MDRISIVKSDITKLDTDAVVNAANSGLQAGGGVCGAIFKAAGYHRLQDACDKIGHCDVGSAVITPGFDLKAKYIIHAVGPKWVDGEHGENKQLVGAYTKALDLAVENNCTSIGFPLISAGIFGYPMERAWCDAISACSNFLDKNKDTDINIVFAIRDDEIIHAGQKILKHNAPEYTTLPATKDDWTALDMPDERDHFILKRHFTDEQMQALRRGNVPQEMEDKWFWYMDGETLYAHRSWTGICLYIIEFKSDDNHLVTVNRNQEQYKNTDIGYDVKTLNNLLNWWTASTYDHYNEWLAETYEAMKKHSAVRDKLNISGRQVDAVFFHKPDEPNGYLSNWYPSQIVVDGIKFTSVEQYIMYKKCEIFGDMDSAKKVLSTEDTKLQQTIGRNANGYVSNMWAGMRQVIVLRGLFAKFSQNEDLKQNLLNTDDAYLVECARTDKVWACGRRLDDDRRFDASLWNGQNILGFALMEVREMLK